MNRKLKVIIFLVSLGLNFILLYKLIFLPGKTEGRQAQVEKYPLLSSRVIYELPNDILINFLPLRSELRNIVNPYGDSFGFYFEYLPTGTSIGVHEKAEFESASLFKLPVVMAYYRKKEREGIVSDPVVSIKDSEIDKGFGDLWKKGTGAKIGIDEAVRRSIVDSDNTAIQVVADYVSEDDLKYAYEGLDNDFKTQNDRVVMSAKGYTSVLKALFFSAVLNKDDSSKILDLLTRTKFTDKLPAGVPSNIKVAHKIGVLDTDMYMDCGIVYVPRRPYSLCMVSVGDENTARMRMADLSKRIYKYVSNVSSAK